MSKGKKKNKGSGGRINYKKANKAQSAAARPAKNNIQQNEVKQSTAPGSRYQETRTKGLVGDTGTLSFNAIDTLFFRESRPMESQGELQSVFPPPIRTLAGAVRTLIGEQAGVVWSEFNEAHPVSKLIGYGDKLGALTLKGAWLTLSGERLFPAPLYLLKKEEQLFQLALDKELTWCDLGRKVRLPKLPAHKSPERDARGSKPLEQTWLTKADFELVLKGELPNARQLKSASDLFERESRLGIARDNALGTVKKGLLYQTQHVRPKDALSIELDVKGLPESMPSEAILRLGGEGRLAGVAVYEYENRFPKMPVLKGQKGLALYLLTPLPIEQSNSEWQPLPGFTRNDDTEQQTLWTGSLNGIELELHGAVTGKVLREGGWDMAEKKPRAVTSFIPAGSVFFCKPVNGDTEAAAQALHQQHIGTLTEYGYGHLAVGVWKDQ